MDLLSENNLDKIKENRITHMLNAWKQEVMLKEVHNIMEIGKRQTVQFDWMFLSSSGSIYLGLCIGVTYACLHFSLVKS